LNKSSILAHRYHTGKNRKSKFTINVLFQSSSYPFYSQFFGIEFISFRFCTKSFTFFMFIPFWKMNSSLSYPFEIDQKKEVFLCYGTSENL
jgi:hypothetical protein